MGGKVIRVSARERQPAAGRAALARWIQGQWQEADRDVAGGSAEQWLSLAWSEGVTALVARGLERCPDAPIRLREAFGTSTQAAVMSALAHHAECRRVLGRLAEHGIQALLLKGSASAHWLYPATYLRECSDIDLMLDGPVRVAQAAQALAALGYATVYTPGGFGHTWLCARTRGGRRIEVDLHLRLTDLPAFPHVLAFNELMGSSFALPALGAHAFGPSPAHALLHACVHRATNIVAGIGDRLKWLYEIHLLTARLQPAEWQTVERIACERGLCGTCLSAIDHAAEYFGSNASEAWLAPLRRSAPTETLDARRLSDWRYMQRKNLAALPSTGARARWLWQRLFPSVDYLQAIYGKPMGKWAALRWRWRRLLDRLRD